MAEVLDGTGVQSTFRPMVKWTEREESSKAGGQSIDVERFETEEQPRIDEWTGAQERSMMQVRLGKGESVDATGFIDEENFRKSILNAQKNRLSPDRTIGAVLPHHNVAASMLGNFYEGLAEQTPPEIIILIGPNHAGRGGRFQTDYRPFATFDGMITPDAQILDGMVQKAIVEKADETLYADEHALAIHANYIRSCLGDVPIVPILVKETRNDFGLEDLAIFLEQQVAGRRVLILCSVDFSHYLTLQQAQEEDEETQRMLLERDDGGLIALDNDHVDSPSSLLLTLLLIDRLASQAEPVFLDHSNSALILHESRLSSTTSYFTIAFE